MRWIYRLIEKKDNIYFYAYARESSFLDGIISYDVIEEDINVIKPCSNDAGDDFYIHYSEEHFYHVIKDNFPEERHVDCG